MMGEVLVMGAAIASFIIVGVVVLVGACVIIGKEISDRSPRKALVIPPTPFEEFEFAGHPNYAGLRNRTKELQADEAARAC